MEGMTDNGNDGPLIAESAMDGVSADESPDAWRLGLSAEEVLTTTRAVRKRLDLTRPVSRAVLEECVRIAAQAPSGRNRQQWDFIFIDDPEMRAGVADIWRRGLADGYFTGDGPAPSRVDLMSAANGRVTSSLDHLTTHLHEVPVLLIPCLRVNERRRLQTIRGQAGSWGSVFPAFWSFMLAARDRGIGTCWTSAHLTYEEEMAELLGIPFETVAQGGLTPVAYSIGTEFKPGYRADTTEFMHWDQW